MSCVCEQCCGVHVPARCALRPGEYDVGSEAYKGDFATSVACVDMVQLVSERLLAFRTLAERLSGLARARDYVEVPTHAGCVRYRDAELIVVPCLDKHSTTTGTSEELAS